MNKLKNIDLQEIEEEISSIGVDISLIESLVTFLNESLNASDWDIKNMDIANLVIVLGRIVRVLKNKCEKLENKIGL